MKVMRLSLIMLFLAATFTQCLDKDHPGAVAPPTGMYTVTVENVSMPYDFFQSGAATMPEGTSEAGPAHPGQSYTFSFYAGKNHRLSFATMYGASNDLFYGPSGEGIPLYDGDTPTTGDITDWIQLWDVGTEINEEPGVGPNTGPQQPAPNTGPDENGTVRNITEVDDGYSYPAVSANLKVMLDYDGESNMFTVTIDNLSESSTGISPVVWGVHAQAYALFHEGMMNYGHGLEHVAEDGNFMPLADYLAMNTGYVSPVAPVLWVLHDKTEMPVFMDGQPDYGMGLETLAETGNPAILAESLTNAGYTVGVANMPEGSTEAGPLFPGDKYMFSFEGQVGKQLSLAFMLGASNDIFFAPDDDGIKLSFSPVDKDIAKLLMLWDAGTEVNEYPGAQSADDTVEGGNVRLVDDGFMYPDVDQIIKVTIQRN